MAKRVTKQRTAEVYRQLENAVRRLPDERRKQLATELVEQADREDSESLVSQLRAAMLASEWSVFQLATRCGVQYTKLRGFLVGDNGLGLESASRLAKVLGLRLVAGGGDGSNNNERSEG
jgi:ribosome-binding protein aMBF1 (putative translation factor)